jgi:sulfonate transport system substrate-binding protein
LVGFARLRSQLLDQIRVHEGAALTLTRRALAAGFCTLPMVTRAAGKPVRLGLQKAGSLVLLHQQGVPGLDVEWVEFNSGPAIMEAINAGAVDFAGCGDTPPIFAQAAGVEMLYVGAQPNRGANIGIVVHADGPIHTVGDLRGKRLAFTKGSTVQNLVVRCLAAAGLKLSDTQVAFLSVADAASAFRSGSVDAFAAWDPYFGIAEAEPNVRVLTTGEGVAPTNFFFVASKRFALGQPDSLMTLLDAINVAAGWAKSHPEQVAQTMAAVTNVPIGPQRVVAARTLFAVQAMDPAIIAQQQTIADSFRDLHIIPVHVDVAAAVWMPPRSIIPV